MNSKTKKITTIGMLCALAYALVATIRIPLILFLEYEPKDVIITIGGLIWGPFISCLVSSIVSTIEMITISEDGIYGLIMNILSSCSFACTAAFIYQKRRKRSGMILGLLGGYFFMVIVMLLWTYLIAPIYMGYPRETVAKLLLPAFLPFNLIKGGLNTAIIMILYPPILTSLEHSRLAEAPVSSTKRNWLIRILFILAFVLSALLLYHIV